MVADPIAVSLVVAEALEKCGVRYLIGGIMLAQESAMDEAYLDRGAEKFGVRDLLERARNEVRAD